MASNIINAPAFAWWEPDVVKRCQKTIAAENRWYIKITHRVGSEIIKTENCALEIDTENGNQFWCDINAKEMERVRVIFSILEDGKNPEDFSRWIVT